MYISEMKINARYFELSW